MPPPTGLVAVPGPPAVDGIHERPGPDTVAAVVATLCERGREETGNAVLGLRRVAEQAAGIADGLDEEAGEAALSLRIAADAVWRLAEWVEQRGFDGVVAALAGLARSRPATFLTCAAAVGFLAGRVLRHAEGVGPAELLGALLDVAALGDGTGGAALDHVVARPLTSGAR